MSETAPKGRKPKVSTESKVESDFDFSFENPMIQLAIGIAVLAAIYLIFKKNSNDPNPGASIPDLDENQGMHVMRMGPQGQNKMEMVQ